MDPAPSVGGLRARQAVVRRISQTSTTSTELSRSGASIDSIEGVIVLASISVRNLDDHVKERLRVRAARNGRSMESEIRAILEDTVREPADADGLFQTLLDRFGEIGGVELELPPRTTKVRAADFS